MIKQYKTPNGKQQWMCSFRVNKINPETGKKVQIKKKGFARKKDVENYIRQKQNEFDEHGFIENSKESFSAFISYWFNNHYTTDFKESVVINKRYILNRHLIKENSFAYKSLCDITTFDIDKLYKSKLEKGFSAHYVREMHKILKACFDQAQIWKKIKSNPVSKAKLPKIEDKEVKIWSFNEINTFLSQAKNERLYTLFLLALSTGARKAELLGLKWEDVDFKNNKLTVNKTMKKIQGVGFSFATPKTKSSIRTISLSESVTEELKKHKAEQDKFKYMDKDNFNNRDLVFSTQNGTPIDPRNTLRVMNRIIKKAEVKKIRFHDLRHTHASILLSEKMSLEEVASRLGHANPKITLSIYSHILPEKEDQAADIFQAALERNK